MNPATDWLDLPMTSITSRRLIQNCIYLVEKYQMTKAMKIKNTNNLIKRALLSSSKIPDSGAPISEGK